MCVYEILACLYVACWLKSWMTPQEGNFSDVFCRLPKSLIDQNVLYEGISQRFHFEGSFCDSYQSSFSFRLIIFLGPFIIRLNSEIFFHQLKIAF